MQWPFDQEIVAEIPEIISNCTKQFLTNLPASAKTVILLGEDSQYVIKSQNMITKLFPQDSKNLNEMAMQADNRTWVWASHPSGSNGHFSSWVNGEGSSGRKLELALLALKANNATLSRN